MKNPLPYPPSWLDITGLCQHFPISESSVDNYIKQHSFPQARMRAGKRVWRYSEVDAWYAGDDNMAPEQDLVRRVYDATKKAAANG